MDLDVMVLDVMVLDDKALDDKALAEEGLCVKTALKTDFTPWLKTGMITGASALDGLTVSGVRWVCEDTACSGEAYTDCAIPTDKNRTQKSPTPARMA